MLGLDYFHETDNSLVSYKTISSGEKFGDMTARVRTGEEFRTRSGFTGFTYEAGPSQDLVLPLWTGRITQYLSVILSLTRVFLII